MGVINRVNKRRILIVGCGALGGILADRLGYCSVITVLDPCPRVRTKGGLFHQADALKGMVFDGIIVATKCYDLKKSLKPLKGQIIVERILFLQNGIFSLEPMAGVFPQAAFVRGVTSSAIGISKQRSVFHYQGDFFLAPESNKAKSAAGWFGRLFSDAGLKTKLASRASGIVWAKLIFSAVMNPLPVITRQGYGVLKTDQEIWKLVCQAIGEGRAVARALGVRLAFDPLKLIHRVRTGDLAGIAHRGTIYQDVSMGHSTELEFITGAIVRYARCAAVKTPALDNILQRARALGA